MVRAGASEVCITPPVGVELAGYGPNIGRFSTGVHDQLTAQALVLADGQRQVALATLDVIGVSAEFVATVRDMVEARAGIPADHVMVAAIHSHTAPTVATMRDWGGADAEYVHMLARQVAGAVAAAQADLRSATLHVGRDAYPDLAWNRTGRAEVDPAVDVLRVDGEDGAPLALLVHYACHPVMLGPKPQISADYPGAMRRYLKDRLPGAVILFANGTCGDIDPVSNREVWGQATFEDVERAGQGLGEVALRAAQAAVPLPGAAIAVRSAPHAFEYQVPDPAEVQAQIARYRAEVEAQGVQPQAFGAVTEAVSMPDFWLRYYDTIDAQRREGRLAAREPVTLQAVTLGDQVALLGLPAEVYTHEGQVIRAQSPYPHTLTICYANGLVGYVPPAEEYAKSSYAAILAAAVYDRMPFQPDVAERLVEAAVRLLG